MDISKFFDELPEGASFKVKPEQVETIKNYMRSREWYGGLHFTADWKKIYKTSIPKLK